jgi:recombination protein RecT
VAETKNGKGKALTLRDKIKDARNEIAKVLPRHMDVERVVRGVRLAVAQNPKIEQCNWDTVLFAVMAASRIGLELNSPLQHAWLVPFGKECTLMIGYRGYQELARRSGDVRNIVARCVYKGDSFHHQEGSDPRIDHEPGGNVKRDEDITHAYAIAFDKSGRPFAQDVLTREEIEAARKVSRAKDDGPWVTWYGEQARKTAVRRLAKYLPLSPDMAAAIELDIRAETGQVNAPIEGIDTDASLAASIQGKTEVKLEELRERMEGQPPKAGGVDPAPAATATAAPPAPAPVTKTGEETPW